MANARVTTRAPVEGPFREDESIGDHQLSRTAYLMGNLLRQISMLSAVSDSKADFAGFHQPATERSWPRALDQRSCGRSVAPLPLCFRSIWPLPLKPQPSSNLF